MGKQATLSENAKGFISRRQIQVVSDQSLTLDDGTTINLGVGEINRLNSFFEEGRPAAIAQEQSKTDVDTEEVTTQDSAGEGQAK